MPTYLDHAATTPLRPQARAAVEEWLQLFGNPSGSHAVARAARTAVEDARQDVAEALGADAGEVVFTGGGTEADNLAVLGSAGAGAAVCTAIEHEAVLEPVRSLGGDIVGVDADGIVDLDRLAAALHPGVTVVSVMLANNETGVVQPLAAVAEVVRRRAPAAVLHTDAVQAFPWLDVATLAAPADLVSVSAHKFGGPQGAGALVVRGRAKVRPVVLGGGQERGMRSGTHNVAGVVGMAAAARVTVATRQETVARIAALRDRLADGLLATVPAAVETGRRDTRVAGNCHLRFAGVESEELLFLIDASGVCASAGSACSSGATDASHVLVAMGIDPTDARSSVRLSLGWCSTDADVDAALAAVPAAVDKLRAGR